MNVHAGADEPSSDVTLSLSQKATNMMRQIRQMLTRNALQPIHTEGITLRVARTTTLTVE